MNKILFVTNDYAPWIDEDENILSKKFNVCRRHLSVKYYINLFQVIADLLRSELIYLWFGSFVALPILCLAKVFQKNIVIVAGGFDVARLDEFNHGAFSKFKKSRWLRKFIFSLADFVFCVSKSNRQEAINNASVAPEKAVLIPLGFKMLIGKYELLPWRQRKNQVVSISSIGKKYSKIKGFDQLMAVAKSLPGIRFVHMGHIETSFLAELQPLIPPNLKLMGFVPFESTTFLQTLGESKVIMQLSAYESFCSAIVEGGLCGCYPITSDRFALLELTQIAGCSVKYGNVQEAADCVLKIIYSEQNCAELADAFLNKFHLQARQDLILKKIEDLIS